MASTRAAVTTFTRGGTVFSAGATDWAQCLGDARVARITRNVLDHLLALPRSPA